MLDHGPDRLPYAAALALAPSAGWASPDPSPPSMMPSPSARPVSTHLRDRWAPAFQVANRAGASLPSSPPAHAHQTHLRQDEASCEHMQKHIDKSPPPRAVVRTPPRGARLSMEIICTSEASWARAAHPAPSFPVDLPPPTRPRP
ncbi:uncharacterized protein BXZ73DRAFT_104419 [Epithele typhae]|uniref:uncharacterized protein n=1 Tax=Epithele typhae TaxID=378194 RepID=UPI0020088384|nr:uncharacterized protein BXZ73DRAFT_104419 [Epithele typhae]KAH9921534.1 hypothetical protein BXZ73DRAFT_104419 [Epithele typhae]